jgi:hypothetical protein
MEIMRKSALVAISVAALAMSVLAQNGSSVSHKTSASHAVPKRAVGEAASLESKEGGVTNDIREDNRGRLSSTRRPQQARTRPAKAAVRNTAQKRNAAHLQTGQLTTRQKTHFKTTRTAVHKPIGSKKSANATPAPEPQDHGNPIHLKQHNARMF